MRVGANVKLVDIYKTLGTDSAMTQSPFGEFEGDLFWTNLWFHVHRSGTKQLPHTLTFLRTKQNFSSFLQYFMKGIKLFVIEGTFTKYNFNVNVKSFDWM